MKNDDTTPGANGFHLGQHVKGVLAAEGRSITWLADEIGCSRDNLYKIFRHSFVSTDLLFKISEAMGHDFFKDCSERLHLKPRTKPNRRVNKKG